MGRNLLYADNSSTDYCRKHVDGYNSMISVRKDVFVTVVDRHCLQWNTTH